MLRRTVSSTSLLLMRKTGARGLVQHVGRRQQQQQHYNQTTRWMAAATSKQKRALNKQQLEGSSSTTTSSSLPPPPAASATGGSDGGGGGGMLGLAAVAVAGGGAAYYYFNVMEEEPAPSPVIEKKQEEKPPVVVVEEEKKEEELPPSTPSILDVKEEEAKEEESASEAAPVVEEAVTEDVVAEEKKEDEGPTTNVVVNGGNRVLGIIAPPVDAAARSAADPPAVTSHPVDGHKVTLESMTIPAKEEPAKEEATSVEDNIQELQQSIDQESSQTIQMAHKALSDTLDTSIFQDLDSLSQTQLKARIVQLATEMKERTKWEAVRLKEFLAMKEKETAEKYLDALQKQRIEFENIMAQKLREQEAIMERATRTALEEKETTSGQQLEVALSEQKSALEETQNAALAAKEKQVTDDMDQKYSKIMEDYKTKMIGEMTERNEKLELLSKQIRTLESALEKSETYHSGSQKAHRVSAAALALAEKLETNQGAGPELEALQMSVGDDSVIAAALSAIPADAVKAGIPTSSELRARFADVIQKRCREAAFVPEGMVGMEGQLLGKFFAAISIPPSADDPVPLESDGSHDLADYYLVRAREHIELGQLELAMSELNKLKGQAAFTIQTWQTDAANRVAAEQALKVIKLEAALLNKELSK